MIGGEGGKSEFGEKFCLLRSANEEGEEEGEVPAAGSCPGCEWAIDEASEWRASSSVTVSPCGVCTCCRALKAKGEEYMGLSARGGEVVNGPLSVLLTPAEEAMEGVM